jgi:GT2 family glycosyltransferase
MGPPEVSVLVDLEGWPDDTARFLASLARHRGDHSVEVVVVDRRAQPEPPAAAAGDGPATYLVAPPGTGFGAAQNLALAAATGEVVVLVDTSLELTGDLLGDLGAAFEDPTVAVAGPYGLVTDDLCDYEERTVGDVAAVQGYCLAARRADLAAAGGVQEAFTWYRNADIDVSLRLRTLDEPPVRRAVATGAGNCTRHTHRAWEATPEAERGERSRHNMGIVHAVFFGRKDLTV